MSAAVLSGAVPTGSSMRIGDHWLGKKGACGYTYLGLLAVLAALSAGLVGVGQHWSTQAQREKERELIFRGEQIRSAIHAYMRASPGKADAPRTWEDLLNDRRGREARHHLRRLYVDPFTGNADWRLIPHPGQPGRFVGVHSRSNVFALREVNLPGRTAGRTCVCDWLFQVGAESIVLWPASNSNRSAADTATVTE